MTDTPDVDGSNPNTPDGGTPDAPGSSSYQRLKEERDSLQTKLQAQENQTAAERRKLEDRIKELEAKLSSDSPPKDDSDRILNLELELARSKAVSKYGLTEEDAALLKGTPEEILRGAEYLSGRLHKTDAIDDKEKDKPKDKDTPPPTGDNPTPPPPKPKSDTLSWIEKYKRATPAERAEMDKAVISGDVDPRPSKQGR